MPTLPGQQLGMEVSHPQPQDINMKGETLTTIFSLLHLFSLLPFPGTQCRAILKLSETFWNFLKLSTSLLYHPSIYIHRSTVSKCPKCRILKLWDQKFENFSRLMMYHQWTERDTISWDETQQTTLDIVTLMPRFPLSAKSWAMPVSKTKQSLCMIADWTPSCIDRGVASHDNRLWWPFNSNL